MILEALTVEVDPQVHSLLWKFVPLKRTKESGMAKEPPAKAIWSRVVVWMSRSEAREAGSGAGTTGNRSRGGRTRPGSRIRPGGVLAAAAGAGQATCWWRRARRRCYRSGAPGDMLAAAAWAQVLPLGSRGGGGDCSGAGEAWREAPVAVANDKGVLTAGSGTGGAGSARVGGIRLRWHG